MKLLLMGQQKKKVFIVILELWSLAKKKQKKHKGLLARRLQNNFSWELLGFVV